MLALSGVTSRLDVLVDFGWLFGGTTRGVMVVCANSEHESNKANVKVATVFIEFMG